MQYVCAGLLHAETHTSLHRNIQGFMTALICSVSIAQPGYVEG